jgi:phage repressor protein C with HTH and peptisase S24 domain
MKNNSNKIKGIKVMQNSGGKAVASNGIPQGDVIEMVTFGFPGIRDDHPWFPRDGKLAVLVVGDTMSPVLQHGDIALIDKNAEYKNGDIVIAIFGDGTHTIKRYRGLKDKSIELYPENKSYDSKIILVSALRAIYKVVQSQKNL